MVFHRDLRSPATDHEDGTGRRFPGEEREYWQSEEDRYHVWGTLERYEEARERNAETTRRMLSIYCSYKIAGVLAADAALSLLLFPREYFIVGLIGSNFLVFVLVLSYCYHASKTRVRQQIRERNSAVLISPDSALRRS
ncbi:MAG TPA: hypothetical protein P5217_09030 [Methanoregulaceae archaeon]|nr:hypothetical protein [Methanoregulaceae archaeon]HPD76381.1 hypothetical protein [Methanoregulaceae archaeon]HRY76413.1 hypothetical protein [Methanoregulaceae archaeon]